MLTTGGDSAAARCVRSHLDGVHGCTHPVSYCPCCGHWYPYAPQPLYPPINPWWHPYSTPTQPYWISYTADTQSVQVN